MKICTVNVPESFVKEMEKLVGQDGLYPSRSELIRSAVREFLKKKLALAKEILDQDNALEFEDFDDENYVRIPVEKKGEGDDSQSLFKTYKILKRLA